jgi:DNA-binding MarR family transcriptional regulator/N-acetylglutamate synthase-like GNAT family acetyltransferase
MKQLTKATNLPSMGTIANGERLQRIAAVRAFNRFYTQQIGVLHESLAKSPFSLTEARILYELAQRQETTATALADQLGIDAGYLSRILGGFVQQELLKRKLSGTDSRQSILKLTKKGEQAFAALNLGSQNEITRLLGTLAPAEQRELIGAMQTIERILRTPGKADRSFVLRPHQVGDIGWIIQRHGIIYAQEYGWNDKFEGLVAKIAADFLEAHDPKRERCWIAEREGQNVGCVFLVAKTKTVAQLRLLLVEPRSRGLGIGERLVTECVRFARQAGYRKVFLWTNNVLVAARHLYEKAGFRLTHKESHRSFGVSLVGETWELKL